MPRCGSHRALFCAGRVWTHVRRPDPASVPRVQNQLRSGWTRGCTTPARPWTSVHSGGRQRAPSRAALDPTVMAVRVSKLSTLLALLVAALLAAGAFATAAHAAGCDLYASPSGSDSSGDGTLANPFQSPSQLDSALSAGQTGCLEAGTYGDLSTAHQLSNSGSAGQDITITGAPGQAAKIVGLVELEGSFTVLSGLQIDGSNNLYDTQRSGTSCPYPVSNGLEIDGQHDVFQYNNFYQSVPSLRGNGIGIGWNADASGTIIRYNRIHDLGQCLALDQMVYVAHGRDVQVYGNWMWNDPHGFGVQIYPAAVNAHVYNNVIDRAGSGITVAGDSSVSGNVVERNVIMNSTGLPTAGDAQGVGISDCWDGAPGSGNWFARNDVFANPGGIANVTGVALAGNIDAQPPPDQSSEPRFPRHDRQPARLLGTLGRRHGALVSKGRHGQGTCRLAQATAPASPPRQAQARAPPAPQALDRAQIFERRDHVGRRGSVPAARASRCGGGLVPGYAGCANRRSQPVGPARISASRRVRSRRRSTSLRSRADRSSRTQQLFERVPLVLEHPHLVADICSPCCRRSPSGPGASAARWPAAVNLSHMSQSSTAVIASSNIPRR